MARETQRTATAGHTQGAATREPRRASRSCAGDQPWSELRGSRGTGRCTWRTLHTAPSPRLAIGTSKTDTRSRGAAGRRRAPTRAQVTLSPHMPSTTGHAAPTASRRALRARLHRREPMRYARVTRGSGVCIPRVHTGGRQSIAPQTVKASKQRISRGRVSPTSPTHRQPIANPSAPSHVADTSGRTPSALPHLSLLAERCAPHLSLLAAHDVGGERHEGEDARAAAWTQSDSI